MSLISSIPTVPRVEAPGSGVQPSRCCCNGLPGAHTDWLDPAVCERLGTGWEFIRDERVGRGAMPRGRGPGGGRPPRSLAVTRTPEGRCDIGMSRVQPSERWSPRDQLAATGD